MPGMLFSILQAGESWNLLQEVVSGGSSQALLRDLPPLEEPGADIWGWRPTARTPPHSRLPQFLPHAGLTSFFRRPGLHLLGLLALDGAQRQHHGTTGAPCGQETVSAWAVEPGGLGVALRARVDSDSSIPSHVSGSPASKGTCWQRLLLVSSKAQGVIWGERLSWRLARTRAGLVVPGAHPPLKLEQP